MAHNSLDLLEPMFAAQVRRFLAACAVDKTLLSAGYIGLVLTETLRENLGQLVRYCQGRMKDPQDVIKIYNKYLGWAPSKEKASEPCTWTLESLHLKGLAIDAAPTKDGKAPDWSAPKSIMQHIAELAVIAGLEAGFYWETDDPKTNKYDPNHFQKRGA